MTHERFGEETRGEGRRVTPQGIADTMASGHGGTPVGGRRGLSRKEVAMKSPSPRASGLGAKQPTKRKSVKQKAKRAAAATSAGIGARTATKSAGKKVMKKASGGVAARKAAATKNTAAKRASKTGASRRKLHQQH
jgi:hypothetical protein